LDLDQEPTPDEIGGIVWKQLLGVIKEFKASPENGDVQDLTAAPDACVSALNGVLAPPMGFLTWQPSP
jgi:hypothetical protein